MIDSPTPRPNAAPISCATPSALQALLPLVVALTALSPSAAEAGPEGDALGPAQVAGYPATASLPKVYPARVPLPEPRAQDLPSEEPEDPLAPPNFDIAVGTLFPISLGPELTLELPGRLLLQSNLGWMPPAYGSLINEIVQRLGGYSAIYRPLVEGALDDAFVARLSGGWRPFPGAGFELFGGYTLIDLNGSANPVEVAGALADGITAQIVAETVGDRVEIDSTLHNVHVGLGWRWVAFEHLVIRASLAYMQTVSSSSSVTTPDAPEIGEHATPIVDEQLNDIYDSYVKLPVVGLSAGYRF